MAIKFGQKLKTLIGTAAPFIGGALGGPFGGIAGRFIQDALGVDSEQAAMTMLESDPESLVKLKAAEQAFKARMRELDIDEEKVLQADRADARKLATATGIWPQVGLSVLFICGYFVILGLFFSAKLMVPMSEAFMVMLGVLTGAVPQILAFWFGSTKGSQAKDSTIAAFGVGRD